MTSVKLKLRVSSVHGKKGTLYYQVIHGKTVRQVSTRFHIFPCEWDKQYESIVFSHSRTERREIELANIQEKVQWGLRHLFDIVRQLEKTGMPYEAEDIVRRYHEVTKERNTVFDFIRQQAKRLRQLGRSRTASTYIETLNSLRKFRDDMDFHFDSFDADMMERYEAWMRMRHLCRNTTSFYMRILRAVYNKASAKGLAPVDNPFCNVYTGIDKTAKRAITLKEIKRIKDLDLSENKSMEFARDIFILSFYLRGMSFIDIAYLRKTDLCNGFVIYNRRKTGQQLIIRWEKQMQCIVEKYGETGTKYLVPIIRHEDGTEEKQYRNKMLLINRKLKKVAAKAGLNIPLTLYVARHSWASIAKAKNIPISVISEAMGHDSESTTQIYLASIQTSMIDNANHKILRELNDK